MSIKTIATRAFLVLFGACALLAMVVAVALMLTRVTEPSFEKYLATAATPAELRTTSAWASYGGVGAAKFVQLEQINKQNVADLELAWTYRTGDTANVFQVTPILVDGRLLLCTPHNKVIALDPLTGAELWHFDAKIREGRFDNQTNCRGVAQWQGSTTRDCPVRIFMATNDARLIALDAATGKRCPSFGTDGEVNLQIGVGELSHAGEYQVVLPPAVVSDVDRKSVV